MKDSKNMVIGMLCAVVCVMAVAYAAFSTSLNVKTTVTVDSNWCVKVKSASCTAKEVTGGAEGSAYAKATTNANELGATFEMKFTQPGDTATCTVVYENCGNLNAKITHVAKATVDPEKIAYDTLDVDAEGGATYTTASDGIEFTISGLNEAVLTKKTADADGGYTTITVIGKYIDVAAGQVSPAIKAASITISSSANQQV